MSFPKPHLFPTSDQSFSIRAKALGHPARLQILRKLNDMDGLYFHELAEYLPLGNSAVSDHLRILRQADFISVVEEGRYNYYTLNRTHLPEILTQFRSFSASLVA